MTDEKLYSLIVRCGATSIRDRGTDFQACCVNPNHQENSPSWGISKTAPYVHGCFACGYRGTLAQLLVSLGGMTPTQAKAEAEVDATVYRPTDLYLDREKSDPYLAIQATRKDEMLQDAWAEYVPADDAYAYMRKRGIKRETAIACQIKFDFALKRVLIPWLSKDGRKLIGFVGRTIEKNVSPKMLPYLNFKKGQTLYFPKIFSTKGDTKTGILVEGEIDAMAVSQVTKHRVVGLGFGVFTEEQQAQMKSLGLRRLIVFTDHDEAGYRIRDKVTECMAPFMLVLHVDYSHVLRKSKKQKKDPASLTPNEIKKLINNAYPSLSI